MALADLHNSAAPEPEQSVFAAVIARDVVTAREPAWVIIPEFSEQHMDGPCAWQPVVEPDGIFYPKKGDACSVVRVPRGKTEITTWTPSTDTPDEVISGGGSYSPPIPQSDVTGLVAALALLAPLASPTFTGTPAAPTAGGGTNTTQIATTAFVAAAINALSSVYQAADAELSAIAGLTSAANKLPYFTGSGTAALGDLTAAGRAILDDADAAAQRTTLGLAIGTNVQAWDADLDAIAALSTTAYGRSVLATADAAALRTLAGLGSIATQAANNVTITGGSVTGITDLTVADGGTGASNASGARTNLGLVIGTDVAPVASPAFTGNPTAPTPTVGDNDTSVANTAFVQTAIGLAELGLTVKDPVFAVFAGPLPANTQAGNVLTASANGLLSTLQYSPDVGGTSGFMAGGSTGRYLVVDEVDAKKNGIYEVTAPGSAGTPWVLTRTTDFDDDADIRSGVVIPHVYGFGTIPMPFWQLTSSDPLTINTSDLRFARNTAFIDANAVDNSTVEVNSGGLLRVKDAGITAAKVAAAVAGNGLTGGAGSALAVNPDGSTLEISSDQVRVKDGGLTGAKIKNFGAPVTSLPGSPSDGDLCIFDPSGWTITGTADLVADVTWMLRYRSSTSKWHFVGGDPLVAKVDTSEAKTAGAAYAAITTAGPGITCAIAGDYQVQVGADIWAINIAAGFMSYDVGGTGALDVDSAKAQISSAITWLIQGSSPPRRKTVTAGQAFLAKYKSTTNTTNYEKRWISVLPVRLG